MAHSRKKRKVQKKKKKNMIDSLVKFFLIINN